MVIQLCNYIGQLEHACNHCISVPLHRKGGNEEQTLCAEQQQRLPSLQNHLIITHCYAFGDSFLDPTSHSKDHFTYSS